MSLLVEESTPPPKLSLPASFESGPVSGSPVKQKVASPKKKAVTLKATPKSKNKDRRPPGIRR